MTARLCLEFDDNKNLFFHGKISQDGECVFQIPKLGDLDNKNGKLTVEAIADSTYFKVYECEVALKNSVEVKMTKAEGFLNKDDNVSEAKVHLTKVELQTEDKPKDEPVAEEKKELFSKFKARRMDQILESNKKDEGPKKAKKVNPFLPKK